MQSIREHWPGVLLSMLIGVTALALHALQGRLFAHPPLEALVLALILGVLWRNTLGTWPRAVPGQTFCSKHVLEFAVLLLGATMDLRQLVAGGPRLLLAVAGAVLLSLSGGVALARKLFRLERKPALLLSVGNAICGNSAIATVAPLIGATTTQIAGAIAFTALLGVGLVLLLPFLMAPLHLSHGEYGVLVGMSVYAVPQVIAASYPVSEAAGQTATLVKLMRVLMLAPIAIYFSVREHLARTGAAASTAAPETATRPQLHRLFPWFIAGFIVLSVLRSLGFIPQSVGLHVKEISRILTVIAMAALGLMVDAHALRTAGRRMAAAVVTSLLLLLALSYALIRLLHLG